MSKEDNKKTPKIRFPGFDEDLEERKLGEVCSEIGDGLHSAPEYDDNGKFFFINGNNLINGHIVINSNETKRVSESTFEKNNKQLDDNTVLLSINGTIGNLAYYQGEPVMLGKSAAYLKANKIDKTFLYSLLQTTAVMNNFMLSLTGTTIKNLGLDAIKNTKISIPELREQERIGLYFSQLDHLITLHQRKLEKLKEYKKGMLQKMFPKNEEKVPEVRFSGFDGEWEKRKFGDLGSVAMCKRVFKEQTTSVGEIPFYKIGTFGAEPDAFISRELFEEYKSKFQYPNVGDMLISASGTIGRTVEYSGEEAYFQDSNIVWFKHDDRIDNSFLRCIYNIVKWNGIEGSTIKRLYNDNFLKTEFYMPTAGEQAKIGTYFRSLDRLIALQQKKIESLKEFKKGCLQQMFV